MRGQGGGHVAQASVHWLLRSWRGESYKGGTMRCLLTLRWSDLLSDRCSLRAYPQRVFWLGRRDASGWVRDSPCLGAGCPGCVLSWSDGPLVSPSSDQRRVHLVSPIRVDVCMGVAVRFGIPLRVRVVRAPRVALVVELRCAFSCLLLCAVGKLGEVSMPTGAGSQGDFFLLLLPSGRLGKAFCVGGEAFPRFVTKSLLGRSPRVVYGRQTSLHFQGFGIFCGCGAISPKLDIPIFENSHAQLGDTRQVVRAKMLDTGKHEKQVVSL